MKHLKFEKLVSPLLYLFLTQIFLTSRDICASNVGEKWVCATDSAGWSVRSGHSSVVFSSKMWVLGGNSATAGKKHDVWHSLDGITWAVTTDSAAWEERSTHTSLALGSYMWVIGGFAGIGYKHDTWRSADGALWMLGTDSAAWSKRYGYSSVIFSGKMWVLGGSEGIKCKHDVWSSTDGVAWSLVTDSAGWSPRMGHSSVVFNGYLWVFGGCDSVGNLKNDVWYSANGIYWYQAISAAPWSPRLNHTSVVFGNNMWVIGGGIDSNVFKNDVWYSHDGNTWYCAVDSAPWEPRGGHSSVVFNNKMWVIGGITKNGCKSDVWFTNLDTLAPSPPESLTANGKNPSPWTFNSLFTIRWKNPYDESGILKAHYKLGSSPVSDSDISGTWTSVSTQIVNYSMEGTIPLYVWLVDSTGKSNYKNNSMVYLRRDTIPPSGVSAVSLDTSNARDFLVKWSKGADNLSGIAGYYLKVRENTGNWQNWIENFKDTFAIYNGVNKHKYFFDAFAFDSAGNFNFLGQPQCSTYVNVAGTDTFAPPPPDSVEAMARDAEAFIYWNKTIAPDLIGYNVYHKKTADSAFSRINAHIVTGRWFHDKFLSNGITYVFVVTSVDTSGNESSFSIPAYCTPMDSFPPARPSDLRAYLLPGYRVKLEWTKSPSYDCAKYNIYSDNASPTGNVNYSVPITSLINVNMDWLSPPLLADTTFTFALRAEDASGHEEKNTNVIVKIKTLPDTLGIVKAIIRTPYAGKKISGSRTTVMAKSMFGKTQQVKGIYFQYRPADSVVWRPMIPAGPQHNPNPDTIPPFFIHWNVSSFQPGNYFLRAVAFDSDNVPDLSPISTMITIDNKHPDELETTWPPIKIVEHVKQETVERMSNNVLLMGNESENNLTRVIVPELALEENTTLSCIIRDPANSPDPYPYVSTGEFRQIWLENGQTLMLGGLTSCVEISTYS